MRLCYLFFVCIGIVWAGTAKADAYPEVVFDNSLIPDVYARSEVQFSGGSWIENVNIHLPVSDTLYFTPGNALSLKYESASGGDWEAIVRYNRQQYGYKVKSSEVLVLKLFVQSEHTQLNQLPRLSVKYKNGGSFQMSLDPYIDEFLTNTWLDLRIPVSKIHGLDMDRFIEGIVFHQNGLGSHHIFVDQIEFLPANYPKVGLSSPAVLSKVTSYDRHIHLQWQLPLTPSIRYVKIYRSEDNEHFEPIAIRPIGMEGSFDYVPLLDKTYYYRIAWVDYDYKESPFSAVSEVTPAKLSDEQLLNLIQLAHVNYFVENFDINSGMYLPIHRKENAVVSINETGLALLSLIIGVERDFVNKNVFVKRVKRIVDFLDKVPKKHGIFTSFYDGRAELPKYMDERPHYSVESTTTIMEALLVVRQYLSGDSEDEKHIRGQITKLWEQINWPALLMADTEDVLVADVGVLEELGTVRPLAGFNQSINTYILAAASTKNSIQASSALSNIDVEYRGSLLDTLAIDSLDGEAVLADNSLSYALMEEKIEGMEDSLYRISMENDTVLYGIRVPFGELKDRSLTEIYRPFLTINPESANTSKYQFGSILKNYTAYVKRRDNNHGEGMTNVNIWGYHPPVDSVAYFRINPAISVSAISIDYKTGLDAMLSLYRNYGDVLFTEYGFRSWLDIKDYDVSEGYLPVNQALVTVMIENARSGLIWGLYSEIPEIKTVKEKIFVRNSLQ